MTVIGLKKIIIKFGETGLFEVKCQEGGTIALMSVELTATALQEVSSNALERAAHGNFLNFRYASQYGHDFYTT